MPCRILVGKCVVKKFNWINLGYDRGQWLASVNTIIKLWVL